jgi:glutathione-specific gamma-glutamylcyclotransferase
MRKLSLTTEHIAKIHRIVEDAGPPAGMQLHTDDDYDAWVARMIGTHPAPDARTRLFAYGSLIWKPEIEHVGEAVGAARGWHRAFCFHMPRFRGTPDDPGLMMALDRGGQCRGVLYDLPYGNLEEQFGRLFRREFTAKPANSMPRWIVVETASGPAHALTFVMNRQSPLYAGRLPAEAVSMFWRARAGIGEPGRSICSTPSPISRRRGFMTGTCGGCSGWWRSGSRGWGEGVLAPSSPQRGEVPSKCEAMRGVAEGPARSTPSFNFKWRFAPPRPALRATFSPLGRRGRVPSAFARSALRPSFAEIDT